MGMKDFILKIRSLLDIGSRGLAQPLGVIGSQYWSASASLFNKNNGAIGCLLFD